MTEKFYLGGHPVPLLDEELPELGICVADHNGLWLVQAGQDVGHDPGRDTGINQTPNLTHSVHKVVVVDAIPILEAPGIYQPLLLVITKHAGRYARLLRKFTNAHVFLHRAIDIHTNGKVQNGEGRPLSTKRNGLPMKIGIIGSGMIGTTLAQRLATAGHEVKIANSRGPETIEPTTLSTGARAVHVSDVAADVEVLITSVPLSRVPDVAPLVRGTPTETVIIDTSNYYPVRDGAISELDDGQVESLWVAERLGRPIAKAWNAITAQSFADKAAASGAADRIAIPVAADDDKAKKTAMALVEDTGFDAFDAGSLTDSWRQQPGTPAYCTDLTTTELQDALAAADAKRSPRRRDLVFAALTERFGPEDEVSGDWLVRLNRAVY